jgi:diguanylate cyclase (GGDEF)-like protein
VLVALNDITARKKAEAYLEFLGKHDVLTKLRNRSFYVDELNRFGRKGPWPVTIIMADLKRVNDQFGHGAGDALLRRAGEVLAKADGNAVSRGAHRRRRVRDLMPDTDERGGAAMVDAIRQLVEMNNPSFTRVHR